ncbi:MAG: hypothetical protein RL385_862 [Pseudomonadota bacterium]|jgi:G:T/U-mismatch repair DNA glycosylase
MTIRSTPTDAQDPPVDSVLEAKQPEAQAAAPELHPEQDPLAVSERSAAAEAPSASNRFWPTLALAGLTQSLFTPAQDRALLGLGFWLTNLVARTTARASEREPEELVEGARVLASKVQRYAPDTLAVLGVTAYRAAFERPRAKLGVQEETVRRRTGHGVAEPQRAQRAPSASGAGAAIPDVASGAGRRRLSFCKRAPGSG